MGQVLLNTKHKARTCFQPWHASFWYYKKMTDDKGDQEVPAHWGQQLDFTQKLTKDAAVFPSTERSYGIWQIIWQLT